MITYDTLSPPHTNYSATPPTQTTLSGWVLAPRRENTLLDGTKGDMEHHTNSHKNSHRQMHTISKTSTQTEVIQL